MKKLSPKGYNPLDHSAVQVLKRDKTHKYEVPDFVAALVSALYQELDRVYWNWKQEMFNTREDWQFSEAPE